MLQIRAVDAALELRHLPADFVIVGSSYDFELEIVGTVAHTIALLSTDLADYLEVSVDAGSNFDPVPDDVQNGFDLGSFSAGQRKAITLRLTVPGATELRDLVLGLQLGEGV
jgi:hypothetical protein